MNHDRDGQTQSFFPESTRAVLRQWVRGMLPQIAEPLIQEEIARLREEELGRVDPKLLAEAVRDWLEPRMESMARRTIRDMVEEALPGIAEPLIKEEIRRIRDGG
ncbi:MAG: hypothetical protein HQL07_15280 [Nitrospirae bacterium]|nr:hypothetical protein [Magnetococcales bacterium]